MAERRRRVQVAQNKQIGAYFERLFAYRARVNGLLALKNELSFKFLGGGKMLPIRADLDFRVLSADGRVAFVDLKVFDAAFFTFSQITPHQLERARRYNAYQVPAGFVVWLKEAEQVVFYAGNELHARGARSRFMTADGVRLGAPMSFDLKPIFAAR